jgi:hypothetical protein
MLLHILKRFMTKRHPRQEVPRLLTREEYMARVAAVARAAGYSDASQVLRCLESGELDGTMAEVELQMLRFLHEGPVSRDPDAVLVG